MRAAGLRWADASSWHITLQFLGNSTADQLECLKAGLGEVRCAPIAVQVGELDCFDRAGILFANVTVAPGLASLQQGIVAATGQCGFVAEARPFHPHIALARAKGDGRRAGLRELLHKVHKQPAFSQFTVHEFLLYESHLGRGGSRYEVRERFPLNRA